MSYRSVACICLLLASAFTTTNSASASAAVSSIEQRFNAFYRVQSSLPYASTRDFSVAIGKAYNERFAREQNPPNLRTASDKDLTLLYRAANLATFYTYDAGYVHDMEVDIDELRRRGLASEPEYGELFTALVSVRSFREAKILAAKHPFVDTEPLPSLREESRGGPTELVLGPDMRYMVHQSVDMSKLAQVIIISSPWCHFCQRAVRDIEADAALRRIMRYHALWLAVPDGSIPFSAVHRWNTQHPHEIMALAYKIQEWPMLDHWDTPTFYFFKKSKLIAELSGWPREGQKVKVEKALRQVNLL